MRSVRLAMVLGTVVAAAAGTAIAAPGFGPRVGLPGDDALGAAANAQQVDDLAFGDGAYLAVWTDTRTDYVAPLPFSLEQGQRDVYAARLDAAGNLLDAVPIPVSQEYGDQDNARVAWNGENWLVTWENQTATQFSYASAIHAVRVAPDGSLLDAAPIPVLAFGSSSSLQYAVTANGGDWLVVAEGSSAGENGILGVRVAADGTVLDSTPSVLVPATYYLHFDISVHSAGGEYLLLYKASNDAKAARFAATLAPIGGPFLVPGLRAASNAAEYFLVWSAGGLYVGSRMAVDGTLANVAGAAIVASASIFATDLTWAGTQWWMVWRHAINGLEAARIAANGTVLDPNGVSLDPANEDNVGGHAAAGGAAGEVRVAWTDRRAGGFAPDDVYSAGWTAFAVPGLETVAAQGAPTQLRADASPGPAGEFLLVFRSDVTGATRVLAQRIDGGGNALDPAPRVLASGPALGTPSVSWDGSRYLVVWADGDDGVVYGRRLRGDGTPIDAAAFAILEGTSPDVAGRDGTFAVVATQPTISIHFYHPFAARVDGATGAVLDDPPVILGQYFARAPRVIAFGGRWLAMWQRNFSHDDPQAELSGAFLETDGTAAPEFRSTGYVGAGFTPDLATSGAEAMVVFRTGSAGAANQDVRALRILPDGTFPDPTGGFVLSAATDRQSAPRVAWAGTDYCAVWQDKRNAVTFFDERTDVYGARISTGGMVLDPDGLPIETSPRPEALPAIASDQARTVIASSIFENAPFAAYRIGLRELLPGSTDAPVLAAVRPVDLAAAPNPFATAVALRFALDAPGPARLTVHDVAGRTVRTLVQGVVRAGEHATVWDGRDDAGRPVATGVYLVRLEAGGGTRHGRLVRLRSSPS